MTRPATSWLFIFRGHCHRYFQREAFDIGRVYLGLTVARYLDTGGLDVGTKPITRRACQCRGPDRNTSLRFSMKGIAVNEIQEVTIHVFIQWSLVSHSSTKFMKTSHKSHKNLNHYAYRYSTLACFLLVDSITYSRELPCILCYSKRMSILRYFIRDDAFSRDMTWAMLTSAPS